MAKMGKTAPRLRAARQALSLRLSRYAPDEEAEEVHGGPGLGIVGDAIEGITGFVGGLFIGIGKGVRGLGRAVGSMFRD